MILIKDIEVEYVNRDTVSVHNYKNLPDINYFDKDSVLNVDIEHIHGTSFVNNRGEHVVIGCTKKVQDIIGLPFEVFSNIEKEKSILRNEIKNQKHEIKELKSRITEYTDMLFIKRLKFLFGGTI